MHHCWVRSSTNPWIGRYFSPVDVATSRPSFRSSPTMRGAPQVAFACHIVRISSRTSLAIAGRPDVPCWLNRRQWSRQRCRGQASTVRGCTNARTSCQRGHRRERHAQKSRSVGRRHGRCTVCLYTAHWCCHARFSRRNARFDRHRVATKTMRAEMTGGSLGDLRKSVMKSRNPLV